MATKKQKSSKKKAIILNHMFTGDYLNNNIGHEIINLFADDNGINYIYLCKDGKFNRNDIDIANSYVIQVRRPANLKDTLEIISVATGLEKIKEDDDFRNSSACPMYAGLSVYDIFSGNKLQQDNCVTFKAERVFVPKEPIYIKHGEKCTLTKPDVEITKDCSRQMREYILEGCVDYDTLLNIIPQMLTNSKDAKWILRDPQNSKVTSNVNVVTAVDIYGIQTRELSYSNAIKYYIDEYPELFREFCEYRKCKLSLSENFTPIVYREWYNIDILIDCGEYVIVVENKVLSGLNGKIANETQLDKYERIVSSEYVGNGKEKEKNPFYGKKYVFVLLTPNHNEIETKSLWKHVTYKDLYEFLKDKIMLKPYKDAPLFCDFVNSLADHAKEDYNKVLMNKKFLRSIDKIKKIKTYSSQQKNIKINTL